MGILGAREAAGKTNDRNVGSLRDPRRVFLGLGRRRCVQQAVRQQLDGGILICHGGIEAGAQKVFQLAG